jgi:hypothetical protein
MAFAATNEKRGIIEPPRRTPWVVALDLYKAGGSFRGFFEFALIGAIVLAFLPGGGMGNLATSWMRGQHKADTITTAPTNPRVPAGVAKPHLPLAPRISDVKIEPAYSTRPPNRCAVSSAMRCAPTTHEMRRPPARH